MSAERSLEALCIALQTENLQLKKRNAALSLSLLERAIPNELPPADFPDAPWAKIDPLAEHPDGVEPGLMIAAMSLDSRLAL